MSWHDLRARPWPAFAVVAALEAGVAAWAPWPVAAVLGWFALGTGWVAIAYLLRRPEWLGKHRARVAAAVALYPFLALAKASARAARTRVGTAPIEVAPGLFVGGWPEGTATEWAQLDLTAELPRRGPARAYACFPMLDGDVPPEPAYRAAVDQALAWRRAGLPVLVHCAYGHGRSVAVAIGVMVAEGLAEDWTDAHRAVLALRPRARMTVLQREFVARVTPTLRTRAMVSA